MEAKDVIELLGLAPLADEGGFFLSTYQSKASVDVRFGESNVHRSLGSAIYYLVTPRDFSALHILRQDELFHFYAGNAVEQIQIAQDGTLTVHALGNDLALGQRPQVLVPGNVWQGTRLAAGGRWALLGTTVSPGFDYEDFELGRRDSLSALFPRHVDWIRAYTR